MSKRVHMITFGCSANQGDSEIMAGILKTNNFQLENSTEASDIIIINTCDVKSATEQKITHQIEDLTKKFPNKKIVITGCMAENRHEKLLKISPNSSIVGTRRITEILDAVGEQTILTGDSNKIMDGVGKNARSTMSTDKLNFPRMRINPIVSIVQISEGCNDFCTFCSTKLAKGNIVSYSQQRILREIQTSIDEGCKEIWLTSQDTGAYGFDRDSKISEANKKIKAGSCQLPELLNSIQEIEGDFKVRVGMMNPNNVINSLDHLIHAYKSDKIYKFLHLPIQSGDNKILKRMARRYTVEQYTSIVKEFRKAHPQIQIWTDIIVGFPGETEEQFENTIKLLKESKPDFTNVSRYARREGTAAYRLKPLPSDLVKERTRTISKLLENIQLEVNQSWIGWSGPILITEKKKENQWLGKNFAYKPIIVESEENLIKETINVKILDATSTSLLSKPFS